MRTMAQPATDERICEECGIRQTDWKGNNGRGIQAHGVLACCAGCGEGIGCTCKETGVRRVVVVNTEENKKAYVKKMDRQIHDWQGKIKGLEKRAKKRDAEKNPAIAEKMSDLKRRIEASRSQLREVKTKGSDWPQKARGLSTDYRRMKSAADDLGKRIKPK